MSSTTPRMTSNFDDPICKVIYHRMKECLPLGLFKVWFRVKDGSIEGLGDLLGYSDTDFNEMVKYSTLSKVNGHLDLGKWQNKLHDQIKGL